MICCSKNFKKKNHSWRSKGILKTFTGGPNCERTWKMFCTKLLLSYFVHTPPTFRHLPISHCWVVICDHIDTRISVSYKWDGEGFWEIFCVRQVVQNPQVLVGGGVLIRTQNLPLDIPWSIISRKWQHFSVLYPWFSHFLLFKRIN